MNCKNKMLLFEWFSDCVYKVTGKKVSGSPFDVMASINAPVNKYSWLNFVKNNSYTINPNNDLPELEEIERSKKRKIGQFYTPIDFIKILLKDETFNENQHILDPACGNGNFLIHIAQKLNNLKLSFDNIYGYDIDANALLVCLGRFIQLTDARLWPNLELRNFLFDRDAKKFDLIIGNPPYKVNLSDSEKIKLIEKYETAEGEKDLYTFFIEAGVHSLQESGKLIILTSNTYLINKQCNKIRNFIFNEHNVMELRFLSYRFFTHAPGVLPVVLVLKNEKPTNGIVKLYSSFSYEEGWNSMVNAKASLLCSASGLRRAYISADLMALFTQMEKTNIVLGDLCKIRVGIQEASKRGDVISKYVDDIKKNDDYKPVVKGREISPFGINWQGKYIHYGSHLTYSGDPNIYENRKILYQNIRNEKLQTRLVATIDEDGFYPKNSLTTISDISEKYSLELIVALLNSSLVNTWFYGNYYSFHITVTQVKTIPIPVLDVKVVKQIEAIVIDIIDCKKKDLNFSHLLDEMNLLVYKLYFPNKKIQDIIGPCNNFLEQMARL